MSRGNVQGHNQSRTENGRFTTNIKRKEEHAAKIQEDLDARFKRMHLTEDAGKYIGTDELTYGGPAYEVKLRKQVQPPAPMLAGIDIDPEVRAVMKYEMQEEDIKSRLHNAVVSEPEDDDAIDD
jgi:hypothetical protein